MNAPSDCIKGNILIVDDTPANLRLLSSMLSDQGYKVRSVINGTMAIMAAQAAGPDLILLDINMPEMNGYQVCETLKADPRTRDIPIIFISALGEIEDKVKAFTVGGVDYITKPFQLEEVLARVRTHLSLRNLQRELERANAELELRVQARTAELVSLNAALERFVPRELLSFLDKNSITEVRLGDQVQRDMTILFSDVRDFTARSEQLPPHESFAFINAFLGRVSPIIREQHGFIDKYLGDGIMAIFPGSADDALHAAIDMQRETADFSAWAQARGHAPVQIGVGLHRGCSMLGIIGEDQRVQGTVISDAVNLAFRLESLTKLYGAPITISEQTYNNLSDPGRYRSRFLGCVQVKGKTLPVSVFEILDGAPEAVIECKLATRSSFEEGLHLYHAAQFPQAGERFAQVLQANPDDLAARLYFQRSTQYALHGVPLDWAGVETMQDK